MAGMTNAPTHNRTAGLLRRMRLGWFGYYTTA